MNETSAVLRISAAIPLFIEGDYEAFGERVRLLLASGDVSWQMLLLGIVAAQRASHEDDVGVLVDHLEGSPQHVRRYADLVLGKGDARQSLAVCADVTDRCRTHFYAALRFATEGNEREAIAYYNWCFGLRVPCLEWKLAQDELMRMVHQLRLDAGGQKSPKGRPFADILEEIERRNAELLQAITSERIENGRELGEALLVDIERLYSKDTQDYMAAANRLASSLRLSDVARAESLYRSVIELVTLHRGPEHQTTITVGVNLVELLVRQRREDEAERWFEESDRRFPDQSSLDSSVYINLRLVRSELAMQRGDTAAAREALFEAFNAALAAFPSGHDTRIRLLERLLESHGDQHEEARRILRWLLEELDESSDPLRALEAVPIRAGLSTISEVSGGVKDGRTPDDAVPPDPPELPLQLYFLAGDYAACARAGMRVLFDLEEPLFLRQAVLISMRRSWTEAKYADIRKRLTFALGLMDASTFEQRRLEAKMLRVTLGIQDPEELLEQADSDALVTALHYYWGAKLLDEGSREEALLHLEHAHATGGAPEFGLVRADLEQTMSDASAQSVVRTGMTAFLKAVRTGKFESFPDVRSILEQAQSGVGADAWFFSRDRLLGETEKATRDLEALAEHGNFSKARDMAQKLLDDVARSAGAHSKLYVRVLMCSAHIEAAAGHPDRALTALLAASTRWRRIGSSRHPIHQRIVNAMALAQGGKSPSPLPSTPASGSEAPSGDALQPALRAALAAAGEMPYKPDATALLEQLSAATQDDEVRWKADLALVSIHVRNTDFRSAFRLLDPARGIPASRLQRAQRLRLLGNLFTGLGRFAAAFSTFREAKSLLGSSEEDGPEVEHLLATEAATSNRVHDPAQAIVLASDALRRHMVRVGRSDEFTVRCRLLLADAYEQAGALAIASSWGEAAVQAADELANAPEEKFAAYFGLAWIHYATPDLDQARKLLEAAIAVLEETPDLPRIMRSSASGRLSIVLACQGHFSEAFKHWLDSEEAQEAFVKQLSVSGSENDRLTAMSWLRLSLGIGLPLALQLQDEAPGVVARAFDIVLRRQGLSVHAARAHHQEHLGSMDPQLQEELRSTWAARDALARAELEGQSLERLNALARDMEEKERRLAARVSLLQRSAEVDRATTATIITSLGSGSALVEFALVLTAGVRPMHDAEAQHRYFAFVVRAGEDDAVTLVDLGTREEIDPLIQQFCEAVPESTAAVLLDLGQRLRRAVFDPIRRKIGDRRALFVIPDGALWRVPFDVLPEDDGSALIDSFTVSYLLSGRDIVSERRSQGELGKSAVFGDPMYDLAGPAPTPDTPPEREALRSLDRFDPLPGTRAEAECVAKLIGADLRCGPEASKAAMECLASPLVLHIATHGFFLERGLPAPAKRRPFIEITGDEDEDDNVNPLLQSGLAFAGANSWLSGQGAEAAAGDGLLTAQDVGRLDLRATELVFLSACQTGLGRTTSGEGVLGLSRAFMTAGARTLVMTLWRVKDTATVLIVERFYMGLREGKARGVALREARQSIRHLTAGDLRRMATVPTPFATSETGRALLQTALERYATLSDDEMPFSPTVFWGAFVCLGDQGPLSALAVV
jgi:CHAT domain-containing protein